MDSGDGCAPEGVPMADQAAKATQWAHAKIAVYAALDAFLDTIASLPPAARAQFAANLTGMVADTAWSTLRTLFLQTGIESLCITPDDIAARAAMIGASPPSHVNCTCAPIAAPVTTKPPRDPFAHLLPVHVPASRRPSLN